MAILMAISKRIPGTKFICCKKYEWWLVIKLSNIYIYLAGLINFFIIAPLMDYLPVWQATYFYSWGS